MLSFIKKLFSTTDREDVAGQFGSQRLVDSDRGVLFEDEVVPRYPPFYSGLPMVAPETLVVTQEEMIGRIRQVLGLTPDEFKELILPLIRSFAGMVHLLPASETHHHKGSGGLFRHSLEVGCFSAQRAQGLIFSFGKTPFERKSEEPRWVVAAFTAGLMHDLGKVASDMAVVSEDGRSEWNPYFNSLWEWGVQNKVRRYFIRWQENRHQAHIDTGMLLVNQVMPTDLKGWLGKTPEIVRYMLEATSCKGTHQLTNCVKAGDSTSTSKDVKLNYDVANQVSMGVPVERHILDAMRRLLNSGRWEVNNKSRVWVMQEGIFIVWRNAVEEILDVLAESEVRGIPRDPDTIADLLLDRDLAQYNTQEDGSTSTLRYWEVAPFSLERPSGLHYLECIKLSKPELLFSSIEPPATGGIVHVPNTAYVRDNPNHKPALASPAQPEAATTAATEEAQDSNKKKSTAAPKANPAPRNQPRMEAVQRGSSNEVKDSQGSKSSADTEEQQLLPLDSETPPTESPAQEVPASKPALEAKSGPDGVIDTAAKLDAADQWCKTVNDETRALLLAIIGSVREGSRKFEELFADLGGNLYLRYPHAIREFAPPTTLVNSFYESGLIARDPTNDARKVCDIDEGKGLLFHRKAATHIRVLLNLNEEAVQPSPQPSPQSYEKATAAPKVTKAVGKAKKNTQPAATGQGETGKPLPEGKGKNRPIPEKATQTGSPASVDAPASTDDRPPKRKALVDEQTRQLVDALITEISTSESGAFETIHDGQYYVVNRQRIRALCSKASSQRVTGSAIFQAVAEHPLVIDLSSGPINGDKFGVKIQ